MSQSRKWQPDVTVAAVCEQAGRFLLVEERAKSSGQIVFNQPAGHLENNESLIDAVIREVKEETCRHFTPTGLVGLYRLAVSEQKTYIRYTFCGTVTEIDPKLIRDSDIIDTHWLSREEIRQHTALRSPLVLDCIEDFLAHPPHPLSVLKDH